MAKNQEFIFYKLFNSTLIKELEIPRLLPQAASNDLNASTFIPSPSGG
jgi:hypothetical protein